MENRKFPPPPPRPHINHEQTPQQTAGQEAPAEQTTQKKGNLRLILLVVGAIVSFIGATVCGYFLFG